MAGGERSSVSSDPRKIKKVCEHCKKDVVADVKCKKCDLNFHPACLRQAASQKNAVCMHVAENNNEVTSKTENMEMTLLKAAVDEMMVRIKTLEDDKAILYEKIAFLEEKVENLQITKKGKQKIGGNDGNGTVKSGNPALVSNATIPISSKKPEYSNIVQIPQKNDGRPNDSMTNDNVDNVDIDVEEISQNGVVSNFNKETENESKNTRTEADSSSQYDAIRAYLKELDITEKVWIGLSKPQEKPNFLWTDFRPLSGEGHWQESLPSGDSQSLCAVMDSAADFLWRALPCGGPEVAAFICELPIPSWALGPKGCLLTELPSLTVLYIPEQSALELTSDCGLDGTKRIACKGNADREEMLRQLTCVISNEDMEDDKSTKTSTSDYFETSTWDDNSIVGKTTKSWTSNTINSEDGTPTRHRRETEDTLSPVSTKSSFKEASATDLTWQDTHQEKVVLTTQYITSLDDLLTPTPATSFEIDRNTDGTTESPSSLESSSSPSSEDDAEMTKESNEKLTTDKSSPTAPQTEESTQVIRNRLANEASKLEAVEGTSTAASQEGNMEDYPSAINQGQLFSIIENGTMFDIIELNETDQESQTTKKQLLSAITTTLHTSTESILKSSHASATDASTRLPVVPTKKFYTKKPVQPTKKTSKNVQANRDAIMKRLTTQSPTTTKRIQSVDEMEENLTKEFEMMPDIQDTSVKLNRTFRKELPSVNDEHSGLESGGQFGVPRIIDFAITNALDSDNDGYQQDQPQEEGNFTETLVISNKDEPIEEVTPSVVKKNEPKLDDSINSDNINNKTLSDLTIKNGQEEIAKKKPEVTENSPPEVSVRTQSTSTAFPPVQKAIDPRLFVLNNHPNMPPNNHSESIPHQISGKSSVAKEDFLPKSLLGANTEQSESTTAHSIGSDGYSAHPFPSHEPKKVNRHRNLHNNKGRKFYPYFFSRMLG